MSRKALEGRPDAVVALGGSGPVNKPPKKPAEIPPRVGIIANSDPVVVPVGIAFPVTIAADPGTGWVLDPEGMWTEVDKVHFTGDWTLTFDTGEVFHTTGLGVASSVTLPMEGLHQATAAAGTTSGETIWSLPVQFVAGQPTITVVTSPAGQALPIPESGTSIEVSVTIPFAAHWPGLTVTVQDGAGAFAQPLAGSGTIWSGSIQLSSVIGPRTLLVTARARIGSATPAATVPIAFTAEDGSPPRITVTSPPNGGTVVADAAHPVTLTGTCADAQSGTGLLGVALSPVGPFTPATTAGNSPGLVSWSAAIAPPGRGSFTVYIRAADVAGLTTTLPWPLEAIDSYVPPTLEARLSDSEYLAALTTFARDTVTTPAAAVSTDDITKLLGQPVDRLAAPDPTLPAAAAGQATVNELRIPVEILRGEIAATIPPPANPRPGQSAYLRAAYDAALSAAGTSYTELRLARGADPTTRQALADRLGIQLAGPGGNGTRPDQLDQLTLSGPDLTEAALEAVFGLPQTTTGLDPLRAIDPSSLLIWQVAAQTARWASEDASPTSKLAGLPIVNPDVITAADVLPTAPPTLTQLLGARSQALATHAADVRAAIAAASAPSKLAAALAASLPGTTIDVILQWQATEAAGGDASAQLHQAGLDRTGYQWMLRMGTIAHAGQPIDDGEWNDTVDVLVGAYRRRQYPAWKAAESSAVVLGPETFAAAASGPDVGPLRVAPTSRGDWIRLLTIRASQRQSLVDSAVSVRTLGEQRALPVLRDALLAALASDPTRSRGEALTRRYQVDFLASGSLTTTRIAQATASVQTLLEVIRSGNTKDSPASAWRLTNLDPAVFDKAWAWFGGIAAWRRATTIFLFPEASLDPALIDNPSGPFQTLRDSLATLIGNDPIAAVGNAVGKYITDQGGASSFTYLSGRNATHQVALDSISKALNPDAAREAYWAVPLLAAQSLLRVGAFQGALDWLWVLFPYTDPQAPSSFHEINVEAATAPVGPDLTRRPGWTDDLNPFHLVSGRPAPYLRNTLLRVASALIRYGDSEFSTEDNASVEHARGLYQDAQALLQHPRLTAVPPSSPGEPTLDIPQLSTLATQVATQLRKIRQGRNIAGLPRVTAAAAGTGVAVRQPTPYHFKFLINRAQQLSQQAVQFEAEYLSLLEKFDAKTMSLLDAQFAATLTGFQARAQQDRVQQADDEVAAAVAQVDKANALVDAYGTALSTPNPYETNLLNDYRQMNALQDVIGVVQGVIDIAAAASRSAGWLDFITSEGVSAATGTIQITGIAERTDAQVTLNKVQRESQVDALRASQEERHRQLAIQLASAAQDAHVAVAQRQVSQDQLEIARAEQTVVDAQHDHAKATLALLANQFTNAELYQWMSETLGTVYQYFLQQATATARLAQEQLAFERVEPPRDFVGTDYWNAPHPRQGATTNARGMTGGERLTEDIVRLEQYAFGSDIRRLNVTQAFSLAQLLPVDFLRFRQSGQLPFTTAASWFDRDFPGHYQRLIKQVHMSVVALVPPSRGIRATLSSTGISRVTTPGAFGAYTPVTVRRDPSTIVATSPLNATGVFALDIQPDLLLPFEGSGVETTWLLSLPQAANPFDFANIADVILTIDYTAMTDPDFQAQVIQGLNRDRGRSADRILSLARDVPDQWYALSNPPPGTPRSAAFTIGAADFPVGFTDVTCAQIAVFLQTVDSQVTRVPVPVMLTHTGTGTDNTPVGGVATTDVTGIASTRRGASQWQPLIGVSPNGTWRVTFDAAADPLFVGPLQDVLIMLTWQAQAPAWPS